MISQSTAINTVLVTVAVIKRWPKPLGEGKGLSQSQQQSITKGSQDELGRN